MGYSYDRNKGFAGRAPNWWIGYAKPNGEPTQEPGAATEAASDRLWRMRERQVADGTWQPRSESTRVTFADYELRWAARRAEQGKKLAKDEHARQVNHVVPVIGGKPIESIEREDIERLIKSLMTARKIAPKTILNLYGELRLLFKYALKDKVVLTNPCTLTLAMDELPKKRDKDPNWRALAKYTRTEIILLLTSMRIPPDRRLLYGLMAIGGMRVGEAAGRRWRDWDLYAEPLGRMIVATQYNDEPLKTERPREVPVHPTLARMLTWWRMTGWPIVYGRSPSEADLIVPKRSEYGGGCRSKHTAWGQLQSDLMLLGLRARRQHDLRRTFTTLARADGANREVLKAITHGGKGDIVDDYTSWEWSALCEAMAKLKLPIDTIDCGTGGQKQTATYTFEPSVSGALVTTRIRTGRGVTPTGIEPVLPT